MDKLMKILWEINPDIDFETENALTLIYHHLSFVSIPLRGFMV